MWKLVKCESSRPDLPHPTGGLTTFTQDDQGIHYRNEGIWSDGRTIKVHATLQLDGTWCPVTGSVLSDSLSLRRLDDVSLEVKMRKGGADVGTNHTTVSGDGLTLTSHWEFPNPDGAVTWTTTSARE